MEQFEAEFILSELREIHQMIIKRFGADEKIDSKMVKLYNWVNEK